MASTGFKKFKFVSPGIQVAEVDRSQIPRTPDDIGPVVVGRAVRGPGMMPVKVQDYSEFVELFGTPIRGGGTGDIWRNGNDTSPMYGMYAAQAYLKNASPLTYVRLLGTNSADSTNTTTALAGWKTTATEATTLPETNGGAFGLFVIPSASEGVAVTGTLAAVWYLDEGAIKLVGNAPAGTALGTQQGAATLVKSIGSTYEFQAIVSSSTATAKNTAFNFNPNSSKYIRKVFNTNPTLTNSDTTPSEVLSTYWLGETYESNLKAMVDENSGSTAGGVYGFIAAIENNSVTAANVKKEAQPAKTGWVIGQDLSSVTGSFDAEAQDKLFRFVSSRGDGAGDWEQNNIKISIQDIKTSVTEYDPYGTFTVVVRSVDDTDASPQFLEVFAGCNLDANSKNFIANRIGDKYVAWDKTARTMTEYGSYDNASAFIRVEMNDAVTQGAVDPETLPFGFFGPTRFKTVTFASGSTTSATDMLVGSGSVPYGPQADDSGEIGMIGLDGTTMSIEFPKMQLRVSSSDAGVLQATDTYFGVTTHKVGSKKFDPDWVDLVRVKPADVDSYIADANTEYQFVFTLDDVTFSSSFNTPNESFYLSGSRASGKSWTAIGDYSASLSADSDEGYKTLLVSHNRFTMPLFGGFDGLDVKEKDPFRNEYLSKANGVDTGNYAVHSLKQAIDTFSDPERVEINLATVPGITNNGVTNHLMDIADNRNDILTIIDVDGGYAPSHENASAESSRLGSVTTVVNNIKGRALNTSYACAYYPWVKVVDSASGFGFFAPPSIVALGTMASSEKKSELWFAPAGFNRGGLTEGSAGIAVAGVREKLTNKQRDALYEVGINPIASFPSEGVVIFGQKTLQATQSAMDRINVRRLLIYLKKEIARIATRIHFDQNVQVTWDRFTGAAEPLLASVKSRFGLTDFEIVLDETTTTSDLIDRNSLYAKIFLKPGRAIEFIGLDFVVTRTGASFED